VYNTSNKIFGLIKMKMKKNMKVMLSILLVTIFLVLLGRWVYRKWKIDRYVPCLGITIDEFAPAFITFTTIPSRLKSPWFKNNLIRRLTIAGKSHVVLNIPPKSLKGETYVIPPDVLSLQGSQFIINHCPKDLGPITKVVPTLLNDDIPDNAVIMVCDDDIKYRSETFRLLKNSVLMHPNCVSSMCSNAIEGYKSYGFIKSLMKGLGDLSVPEECNRIDDDVIQQYVKHHKIKVVTVPYPGDINSDGWRECSTHDTTEHPEWEELRDDDRNQKRKQCFPPLRKALSRTRMNCRVFDCFMASTGEEDLLLLRIMTTAPYVYRYIIMDSDESHTGLRKPLIDLSVIPKYLRHKVVYENVQFPETMAIQDPTNASNSLRAWSREAYQRNRIMAYIHEMALDNDFCYISDLDEIPFYDRIISKLSPQNTSGLIHYETPTYVYNINFSEVGYIPRAAFGVYYRDLEKALSGKHATLTNLRFEGVRKHDVLDKLKHLQAKKVEKGCVAHLNRFYNPAALVQKNANIAEGWWRVREKASDTYRTYFMHVCDGQDGSHVDGTHIRKKKVVPDVPPLVYKYLHPIHTMSPDELTRLHSKVEAMSESELKSFVEAWF